MRWLSIITLLSVALVTKMVWAESHLEVSLADDADSNAEMTVASVDSDTEEQIPVSETTDPDPDASAANTDAVMQEDPAALLQELLTEDLETASNLQHYKTVVLNILDKIAGKSAEVPFVMGKQQRFGNLLVTAELCENTTESHMQRTWLRIIDNRRGRPNIAFFTGWMFSDSPSLSALEHPEYDVTLVKCE